MNQSGCFSRDISGSVSFLPYLHNKIKGGEREFIFQRFSQSNDMRNGVGLHIRVMACVELFLPDCLLWISKKIKTIKGIRITDM